MKKETSGTLCSKCNRIRLPDSFFCGHHNDRLPRKQRQRIESAFERHMKKGNARSKGNLVRAINAACNYLAQYPDEPVKATWRQRLATVPGRLLAFMAALVKRK